jgi:dipeptide/tripeptide permease
MSPTTLLALVACGAAIYLLTQFKEKVIPGVCVAATGIDAVSRLGVVHIGGGQAFWLIVAVAIAVSGGMLWLKVSAKNSVSAATGITLVGALEVLHALKIF